MTASTDQERAEFLEQVGHLIMDGTIETRSTKRAGISFACGNLHAAFMVWRAARRATAVPVPQGWIDPNDKAQKQYLPHIGERVLFKHDGCVYLGKHTGGSFKAEYPLGKTFGTWDCKWMYPSVLDAAAPHPPEADHIPDAGKMDTNVRNWMNAALSKDVACPACGLSGLHACPSASTAESQGADAVKALEKVLRAVQRHLPPERIGERETIAEIISIVDPWPLAKPPANET